MKKEISIITKIRGEGRNTTRSNSFMYIAPDADQRKYISGRLVRLWVKRGAMSERSIETLKEVGCRWFINGNSWTPDQYLEFEGLCKNSRHKVRNSLEFSYDHGIEEKGSYHGPQARNERRAHLYTFADRWMRNTDPKEILSFFGSHEDAMHDDNVVVDLPEPSRKAIRDTVVSLYGPRLDLLEGLSERLDGIDHIPEAIADDVATIIENERMRMNQKIIAQNARIAKLERENEQMRATMKKAMKMFESYTGESPISGAEKDEEDDFFIA